MGYLPEGKYWIQKWELIKGPLELTAETGQKSVRDLIFGLLDENILELEKKGFLPKGKG